MRMSLRQRFRLASIGCVAATAAALCSSPSFGQDPAAQYEALLRQFRDWKISGPEFERRKQELTEKYGLQFDQFGGVRPAPTARQLSNHVLYVVSFNLNGALLTSHPAGVFDNEKACHANTEAQILGPTRQMLQGRSQAWFMDANTVVEWSTDRLGRGFWLVSTYRCGPDLPEQPEQINQRMGINVPAMVNQAVQQIRARGFNPG